MNNSVGIYEAMPKEKPMGGVLVLQEVFGVNSHIRAITDQFARFGWLAWAPQLFDSVKPGVELDYSPRSLVTGRDLVAQVGFDRAMSSINQCAEKMRERLPDSPIVVIGYCWGGTLAWLSSTRLEPGLIDGAVCYYGRQIVDFKDEENNVPVILHFGKNDSLIPMESVKEIKKAKPHLPLYVYDAGHGFNCDDREDFDEDASQQAKERTLDFIEML